MPCQLYQEYGTSLVRARFLCVVEPIFERTL